MAAPAQRFFFEQTTDRPHGHDITTISVWMSVGERDPLYTIDSLIESCIDNKIGYQDQATADRQRERFELLKIQRGVVAVFQDWQSSIVRIRFSWQHYTRSPRVEDISGGAEYCEGDIHLPDHRGQLLPAIKLYKQLESAMTRSHSIRHMESPAALLAFLKKRRAVQLHCERINDGGFFSELCSIGTRPVEYSLALSERCA